MTSTEKRFDQATKTSYLGKKDNKYIFLGTADPTWCIGQVPNGGYVASIILGSVIEHFSTKHQTDPIAMNCFFLQKTICSQVLVEITEVKMSKRGYCVISASLKQSSKELSAIEDYHSEDWTEKVRTIVTMGHMDSENGVTILTDNMKPPSTEHLVPYDYIHIGQHVRSLFDMRNFATETTKGKAEITQLIEFSDGRPVDFKSMPFWCDMFITPPFLLGEAVHGEPIWCPTMQMEIQFKSKIDTVQILSYFLAPHILNNRFDIDGFIWDKNGKLLALTRHQCLIVPWSRNTKDGTRNTKL